MTRPLYTLIILLIATLGLGIGIVNYFQSGPKIGFVKSQELIYGYQGMKAAQQEFETKTQAWSANSDTLMSLYQQSLKRYQDSARFYSDRERQFQEGQLRKRQENVQKYQEMTASKMKEEEEKMLEGVFNQVNSFVEQYAERNNYDIILGTTLSGSLLYGEDHIDVTDEVLKELNQYYTNGSNE
ncbi:OmpH/Skp family outer membrane protein [Halocola ammonii]